jgi:hypothetical protein
VEVSEAEAIQEVSVDMAVALVTKAMVASVIKAMEVLVDKVLVVVDSEVVDTEVAMAHHTDMAFSEMA